MVPCDDLMPRSMTTSSLLSQPKSKVDANAGFEILRKAVSEHISQFESRCQSIVQLLNEDKERLKTSLAHSMHLAQSAGTETPSNRVTWSEGMPLTPSLPPVPVEPPLPVVAHPVHPLTPPGQAPSLISWNTNERMAQNGDGSSERQRVSWHPLTDQEFNSALNEGKEMTAAEMLSDNSSALRYSERSRSSTKGGSESAIANWERMYTTISIPKENRRFLKVQVTGLQEVWTMRKQLSSLSSSLSCGTSTFATPRNTAEEEFEQGPHIHNHLGLRVGRVVKGSNSCIPVVHPGSKYSSLHSVMQGALIMFDVVEFPLSTFRTRQPKHGDITLLISVFFWTWDLIFSFLQGFVSNTGVIEMRPSKIARNYLRSWFIFDLVVVVFDWVSFVAFIMQETMQDDEPNLRQATKLAKVQRLARGVRILRLAKILETCHTLLDGTAAAESVVIIGKICGLLLLIVLINHYIACAWYAIAEGSDREDTWIKQKSIIDYNLFDRYFYSLHWSLTQFTPCTNDIAPTNGEERAFACLVVIFALITFSTFLSSLTSAIMQMKKLNWERYSEQVQIRDFMQGKQVPTTVAQRVWQYYRRHYRLRNRIVVESEVHFFQVMPKSLRKELRCHAYIPTLMHHLVMREIIVDPRHCMGASLCEIVSVLVPVSGQDVFLEGEEATHMYFFVSGEGTYTFWGGDQQISAPDHMTEAALWLRDWQHPGRLTVTNNRCELLLLGARMFASCMERQAHQRTVQYLKKYASLFAQYHQDLITGDSQVVGHRPTHVSRLTSASTPFQKIMTSWARYSEGASSADLALPPSVHAELVARAFPNFTKAQTTASFNPSLSHFSGTGSCSVREVCRNVYLKVMHKLGFARDLKRSSTTGSRSSTLGSSADTTATFIR